MHAIDTNVVVRILLNDDPDQAEEALALVREGVFVPITVLLEAQWLLASRHGQRREEIVAGLWSFLSLDTVSVADWPAVDWALGRYAAGADFSDMVHLILAAAADDFATFDRSVAKQAGDQAPVPVLTLGR